MGRFWGPQSPDIWAHFWQNVLIIGSYILSSSLQLRVGHFLPPCGKNRVFYRPGENRFLPVFAAQIGEITSGWKKYGIDRGLFLLVCHMYSHFSACEQKSNIHTAYLSHFETSAL